MKLKNKIIVFSILLFFLLCIGSVSANETEDVNLTFEDDSIEMESYSSSDTVEVQASEELQSNVVINQRNYKMYFDDNNVLKPDYGDKILTFDGTFTDKGVFTIDSDNTKITGRNTLFNNTVFNIKADGVMLTNIKFVLNESFTNNHNAGVYVTGDNVTLYNIDMTYDTPSDVDAFGVYSYDNTGFKLINSSFKYIGHAYHDGHNYDVLLQYSDDSLVSGNKFDSTLPLRPIDWSMGIYGGVGTDKVASFAAGDSKNIEFSNNNVYSTVNFAEYADHLYPTLSSVLIYGCDNSTINKNNIKVEDFHTRRNQANYLYALDIYRLNDVTVIDNVIDVFTYGGHNHLGTAYPIQVTGPAYNIKIAYNNLHSVSNGPNIGIYSQNYYGSTQLEVISNFINITGKAGSHQWALVAGIEVQDSHDHILNNTIIVDTVGGYKAGDRIFGISYSQNTQGTHEYDIRYNKVKVPGPIAISLNQGLESTTRNTNVMYNILITGVGEGGDRAVSIGGKGDNNVVRYNTNGANTIRHMSERDLPGWLKSFNGNGKDHGVDLTWLNGDDSHGNGIGDGAGSGNSLNGEGHGNGLTIKSNVNGNNLNPSKSSAVHGDMNSTHYTYGESGVSIASASSSAGSGSGSTSNGESHTKAYEVTKKIAEPTEISHTQTIIGILLVMFLLIVGYREKDRKREEY